MLGCHIRPGQARGGFTGQPEASKPRSEHMCRHWSIAGIRDAANRALMKRGLHNLPTSWDSTHAQP